MGDGGRVQAQSTRPAGRQQFLNAQLRRDAEAPAPPPADALVAVAARLGVGDSAAFLAAVERLHVERQQGLLEHAAGVAQHLQARGRAVGLGAGHGERAPGLHLSCWGPLRLGLRWSARLAAMAR